MAAASVPEIPFTADGRLRSRAVIPQSETCQKAGAGLPARPVSAPSRHLHVPVAVNAERSDASFPDSIKDLRQRVLPQIFTAFPLRPSRSLRASGNLCRPKYTQKLRGMEINLFNFHSRSATIYVTRQRQIYAFHGLITLISKFC